MKIVHQNIKGDVEWGVNLAGSLFSSEGVQVKEHCGHELSHSLLRARITWLFVLS